MLETLRAYGAGQLTEAGEQEQAEAALARYALRVAGQAAAGLQADTGESAAASSLDAEDATTRQVLAWVMDHDAAMALRLAVALAPWWQLRGRQAGQYSLLRRAAECAGTASGGWRSDVLWLTLSGDRWYTSSRLSLHRDRVDLDEELRPGQPGHADERVGGLMGSG
jgi:hypothetical protein